MHTTDVRRLYVYGHWATARLLKSAQGLSDEAVRRATGGSFGSLHGTLDHLYGVEHLWLARWQEAAPGSPPSLGPEARVSDFLSAWQPVWEGQIAFVTHLTDEPLDSTFEYKNQSGNLARVGMRDMLVHVANHGTYHRGQIAQQIRSLGGMPAATDFLLFAKESATA